MTARDTTIWTCDRCGLEVEHHGAPGGWHYFANRQLADDYIAQEIEVCKRCADEITWTVKNVVRAAGEDG